MNYGWKKKWVYAMYKGDELLAIGTKDEICKEMKISHDTFTYYRTKAYLNKCKNRKNYSVGYRVIIRIEDEE